MRVMRRLGLIAFVVLALGMTSCFDKPDGIDTATQMLMDMQTIDEYVALNNIDVYKDKTGIRFAIDELGTGGFPPRPDQLIKIKYTGRILDGNVFDSRDAQGVLNTFIPGWQYGLSVWPAGTKGKLYVPSPLAYGDRTVGTIPPNSILAFDVELKEVVPSNADKARFTADTTAIDDYIESHNIQGVVKDSTGIRYVIHEAGTGPTPTWYLKCKFKYTGTSLTNGLQFFDGASEPNELFDSRVVDFINGVKFGLTKIAVGGKISVYIPSPLAFGPFDNPQTGLAANSIVKYDIELLEIIYD